MAYPTRNISIVLPWEDFVELQKRSKEQDVSMASIVKKLIRNYVGVTGGEIKQDNFTPPKIMPIN